MFFEIDMIVEITGEGTTPKTKSWNCAVNAYEKGNSNAQETDSVAHGFISSKVRQTSAYLGHRKVIIEQEGSVSVKESHLDERSTLSFQFRTTDVERHKSLSGKTQLQLR